MKESKIISFRVNTDFYDSFDDFCTRNKISKREAFTRSMESIFEIEKLEKNDLPTLNVPPKYRSIKSISIDVREQKKYKNFKNDLK